VLVRLQFKLSSIYVMVDWIVVVCSLATHAQRWERTLIARVRFCSGSMITTVRFGSGSCWVSE